MERKTSAMEEEGEEDINHGGRGRRRHEPWRKLERKISATEEEGEDDCCSHQEWGLPKPSSSALWGIHKSIRPVECFAKKEKCPKQHVKLILSIVNACVKELAFTKNVLSDRFRGKRGRNKNIKNFVPKCYLDFCIKLLVWGSWVMIRGTGCTRHKCPSLPVCHALPYASGHMGCVLTSLQAQDQRGRGWPSSQQRHLTVFSSSSSTITDTGRLLKWKSDHWNILKQNLRF